MALITASAHPAALWPGVKKWFGSSYELYPEEWMYLLDTTTSDKRYEERILSTGFDLAPEKPEGQPASFVADQQGYMSRIQNKAYSLGFQVTFEELMDNQYSDKAFDRAAKLAFSMKTTKETVCANIYNLAFTDPAGGDTFPLISAAHPTASGPQSNILATPADLSELSLEDLAIQISKAKSFEGKLIALRPFCLVIPPDLQFEAERILNSTLQSGTANNDINALKNMGIFPGGIKVNHYLTDTDAFFVRTMMPEGTGMIYQERFKQNLEKDNEFTTKNAQALSYMRFGVGWADWKALYASPGA